MKSSWPRILGLGVFLVAYGTNVSTPFLVTYKERLELGDSATMAIFTVYVIGIMGILPFGGQLSDRYGRRTVAIPFVAISALASLVMIFGKDSLALLLVGRFLLGAVSGAVLSIGAAWMQEILGRGQEQRSAVMSTLITYAGFGLGPPVSALFHQLNFAPLVLPFVVHIVATLLVLPFLFRLPETAPKSKAPFRLQLGVPAEHQRFFKRSIVPSALWVFSFPSAGFALFPVVIRDAVDGSPVVVAAISGVITAWAALIARPLLPRIGATRSQLLGMASGTIGYILGAIGFGTGVWQLVLPAAAFLGAASGLITAGALDLLARIANDETRGSINATFYLLAYPGMAMPILLTTLGAAIGLSNALIIATLVAALVGLTLLRQSGVRGVPPTDVHRGRS